MELSDINCAYLGCSHLEELMGDSTTNEWIGNSCHSEQDPANYHVLVSKLTLERGRHHVHTTSRASSSPRARPPLSLCRRHDRARGISLGMLTKLRIRTDTYIPGLRENSILPHTFRFDTYTYNYIIKIVPRKEIMVRYIYIFFKNNLQF